MGSLLSLFPGDLIPAKPLTILTAVIHQQGIVAIDTVQDLSAPLNPPFNQERGLSPPLGACHVPNNPSGLLRHGQSSPYGIPNHISYRTKMQNIRFWSLPVFPLIPFLLERNLKVRAKPVTGNDSIIHGSSDRRSILKD